MIKNAFAYITRKSLKSIIIMLVILAMSTLSLISLSIKDATDRASKETFANITNSFSMEINRQVNPGTPRGGGNVKGDKNLDSVIKEIEKLDINWREYNLIKSSSNYPALQQSISGIYSISNKLFAGSLIFAGVVVSLLLLLWMNARKKEIAVLLSLGISKLQIFGQFLIEMVFISIPAYVGSYFLARYTAEKLGNNILNKVTGDIAKQIARQSASSQLGGGAEAEGFNKTLSSLDINVLPKFIFYVVIFMSLVLLVSLIISSFNILRRNPKELLIDNK